MCRSMYICKTTLTLKGVGIVTAFVSFFPMFISIPNSESKITKAILQAERHKERNSDKYSFLVAENKVLK